jgi:2-oxoglutarate/2-oxoacid ferredoxin oxidoreductase subunit alpha
LVAQPSGVKSRVIQGNEAMVEGAIAAGCRFFAGYPITPASEVAELMSKRLPDVGGTFMQMEDEIASICAVMGAVWGGAKACTASSGPGISLMQEGVGWGAVTETPCVIMNVMRGGPSTGQPTISSQQDVYQAKYGSHGDYEIIAVVPSSVQEAYELTIKAFNLAETYRLPVYVLSDEVVGHTREKVKLGGDLPLTERKAPASEGYKPFAPGPDGLLLDGMPAFNQGYRLLVDGQLHNEEGNRVGDDPIRSGKLVDRLCRKITDHVDDITDVEQLYTDDAEVAIFAYGSTARPAMEAVMMARQMGIKAGILRPRVIWPFPDKEVKALAATAKTIYVPEMNIGKMHREVQRVVGGDARVVSVPRLGGIMHTPAEILELLKEGVRA